MIKKNKPQWKVKFRSEFQKSLEVRGFSWVFGLDIEHFISCLLSKVIDEIELQGQGEFHTSKPIDERFDAGYDKAVSDLNKIKLEKKQKHGIE